MQIQRFLYLSSFKNKKLMLCYTKWMELHKYVSHVPSKTVNLWSPKPPDFYCALLTPHWQRNGGQHDNDYYFGVFSLLFRQRTPLLRFTASSRRPFPNRCPPSPLRKGKVRKIRNERKKVNQAAKFIPWIILLKI